MFQAMGLSLASPLFQGLNTLVRLRPHPLEGVQIFRNPLAPCLVLSTSQEQGKMGPAHSKLFALLAMPWSPAWAINSLTGLFNFITATVALWASMDQNLMALVQTRMTHNEHPLKCTAVLYRWPCFHELSKELARSWEIVRCLF